MAARTAAELNQDGVELAQQRKLNEAIEFFRKAIDADAKYALAYRNLGNAYLELGQPQEAIGWYERTLEVDPRSVESLNNLGMLRSQSKNYAGAIEVLSRAVHLAPDYPAAFNNLGIALAAANLHAQSVAVFRRALALTPDSPEANNNLGLALVESGWPDQAIEFLRRAIDLKPNYADAQRNLGIALADVGQLDEALTTYQRAIDNDPASESAVRMNRAKVYLQRGEFETGWTEYEHRLHKAENVRVHHDSPRWDGSPLEGRTLLIEAEQGLGDTIQFVRLAALIKRRHDCKIVFSVESKLLALLGGVEGVDLLVPQDQPRPSFDVWSPLLSLPGLLNLQPTDVQPKGAYLQAHSENVECWSRELRSLVGLKIGIAWQGNPHNKSDRSRSFPLRELAPIGKLHGLSLINLQKGSGADQLNEALDFQVVQLGKELDAEAALFDTAAVMKNLDLVISADTSIVHLAGALGVPVWVPLAFVPDWRWGLSGETTPWYPTMRLFRQEKLRDWAGVFERMRVALLAEFPKLRVKAPEEHTLATSGFNRLAFTRHGPLIYNRHDATVGKSLAELGEYSLSEVDVFKQAVRPGATVVEAGSHVGAHTIPLARLAGPTGTVHAFECQRLLFQSLSGNVALSSLTHVHCHHAAVGESVSVVQVPLLDFHRPNHFASLELGVSVPAEQAAVERVPQVTIDSLKLARCNFLKLDINGMELAALRGSRETLSRLRPIVYVANDRQKNGPAVIEMLLALGYKLYWHVPRYYEPENYFGNATNAFGSLASLNMLGIHSSTVTDIQGLKPITGPQSEWQ